MPNPYSVKGMKKVMDDARGIEQMLQKRHEDQQKMIIIFDRDTEIGAAVSGSD